MFPEPDLPVPDVTTDQMVEVDRAMIEDLRIELIQMMENAGRGLATVARDRFLGGDPRGRTVVVLAGTGGNGGGAIVGGRRLHAWGAEVRVLVTAGDEHLGPVPAHQLDIVRRMGVPVGRAADAAGLPTPDLVVDGVIGYSLRGAPRGDAAELIRWANGSGAPVLSLDSPSGLDTTTGTVHDPAARAAATVTLALPKRGLLAEGVAAHVGELYLADLSVPPSIYPALGLDVGPLFARSDVLRLR